MPKANTVTIDVTSSGARAAGRWLLDDFKPATPTLLADVDAPAEFAVARRIGDQLIRAAKRRRIAGDIFKIAIARDDAAWFGAFHSLRAFHRELMLKPSVLQVAQLCDTAAKQSAGRPTSARSRQRLVVALADTDERWKKRLRKRERSAGEIDDRIIRGGTLITDPDSP